MDNGGKGFGLLFEMGCGKSLTAIAIMGALFEQGLIRRVLVACPGSIVAVWESELAKFAAFPYRFSALLGTKAKRLRKLEDLCRERRDETRTALQVAAINYESTFRDGMFDALWKYGADLIICDESQRIKNPKAQQTLAMQKLAEKAKYRLALTGTPIQQDAQDVFAQYKFLDNSVFGDNFYAFRARYCKLGGFGGKQVVGIKNEDELSRKMYSIAYRVTKAECLDLPPETFVTRSVELSPAERKHYDELRIASVTELSQEATVCIIPAALREAMELKRFSASKAIRAFSERGYLITGKDGKAVQSKWCGEKNRTVRVNVFRYDAIFGKKPEEDSAQDFGILEENEPLPF